MSCNDIESTLPHGCHVMSQQQWKGKFFFICDLSLYNKYRYNNVHVDRPLCLRPHLLELYGWSFKSKSKRGPNVHGDDDLYAVPVVELIHLVFTCMPGES